MKIGCDPEMFLVDAAGGLVSAIEKIGGSKEAPLPLPIGDGFAVQEDNVALEYNIPAADNKDQLVDHINRVLNCLQERVKGIGLHFSQLSAAQFPIDELMHPRALEFGCDPDFNAWTNGRINPRPKANDITLRSCGGHIHVGHNFKTKKEVVSFIKHMDLFLGVPSQLMDNGQLRKQLYGKAGAFRQKSYGCEYRVLSNFWTFDSKLVEWVWNATEQAMDAWQNKKIDVDTERNTILTAINASDNAAAQHLISKYNLPLVYA